MKNRIHLFFLFVLLIVSDQIIKILFSENSFCNKNIAWSIQIGPGVFYFFWLIIFFYLIYYFLKSNNHFEKMALTFILSGAISNLTDRLTRGCVTDFIDLKFWPAFNLADIYITIGIAMLIIKTIKNNRPA